MLAAATCAPDPSTDAVTIAICSGDVVLRERLGTAGRNLSALSFHSLRHSFNSALANSGVSQELRQKLTGHASVEMNRLYTHTELETLRNAVVSLPRLPKK